MQDSPVDLEPLAADELVQRGALLLDVREPNEFDAGHAPTALLIPLGTLDERAAELEGADEIVCVCRSGVRSEAAAELLRRRGARARNLTGGMQAWASEGLPVVTTSGASGTVI